MSPGSRELWVSLAYLFVCEMVVECEGVAVGLSNGMVVRGVWTAAELSRRLWLDVEKTCVSASQHSGL